MQDTESKTLRSRWDAWRRSDRTGWTKPRLVIVVGVVAAIAASWAWVLTSSSSVPPTPPYLHNAGNTAVVQPPQATLTDWARPGDPCGDNLNGQCWHYTTVFTAAQTNSFMASEWYGGGSNTVYWDCLARANGNGYSTEFSDCYNMIWNNRGYSWAVMQKAAAGGHTVTFWWTYTGNYYLGYYYS